MKNSKLKFLRNIIITLIALGIVAAIFKIAPDYILPKEYEGVILLINNKDVTSTREIEK